jgi:integrase
MLRERALDANPAVGVQAPKAPKRLPETMDVDLMTRLLEFRADTELSVRDKAIMELFYSSGLRLAELVGLNLGDVDRGDHTVRVLGKGSKTRVVPVGKHALDAIGRWLAAIGWERVLSRSESLAGRDTRGSGVTFTRTCSAIRSRPICWSRARTCAVCRNCSGTRTSRRRRSIRTLISSTSPRSTTLPTPARDAKPRHE